MKFNILITILIGLSFSVSSQDKRFSISTNLLNWAVSGPSVALNYQHNPRLGFQVYGSSGSFDKYFSSPSYQFKTAIVDVKYSVVDGFFRGVYGGTYLRYIDKRIKREGYIDHTGFISISPRDFHGQGISSGLLLGLRMQDTRLINLEIFGGAGYGKFISQKDYSGHEKQSGFIDGRVGVLLGLKF